MTEHPDRSGSLDRALEEGIEALGVEVAVGARGRLIRYLELLARWNRAYNLTAVRDPLQMVSRHLLDSLSILSFLRGSRLLDIGTGAGLPGLVIAIARPDLQVVVLDSNAKKTRFCTQVTLELGLPAVEVVHARADAYRPGAMFDTAVSRATLSLDALAAASEPLLVAGGRLLAMKGPAVDEEIREFERPGWTVAVTRLEVPGVGHPSSVVVLEPETRED